MQNAMTKKQEKLYQVTNQLLHDIQTKPWLAEGLAEHNYNEGSLAEGRVLMDTAYATAEAKKVAYAQKLGATRTANTQFDLTWQLAGALADNCVTLFQGHPDYLDALGLHDSHKDDDGTSRVSRPHKKSRFPGSQIPVN